MADDNSKKTMFRVDPETEEVLSNYQKYGCISRQELINTAVCYFGKHYLKETEMPRTREELEDFIIKVVERKLEDRRPGPKYCQ